MNRLEGWEQSAAGYFRQVLAKPYAWGAHDCALFTAGAINALTGEDFGAPFRGAYHDQASAEAVLRSLGCSGVMDLPAHFGLPPIEAARRGDVVAVEGRLGPLLAIQWAPLALSSGPNGIVHIGHEFPILGAWGVG